MKNVIYIMICIPILVYFPSCCKDEKATPSDLLGEITVALDANKTSVRTKEALIGNMICDGLKKEMERRAEIVDFTVINGGDIRFNSEKRPNGIYPAGMFTSAMIEEMLPFANANVIVKVTGKELKSIFERSVAQLPLAQGPFLQVSKELKIIIDTSKVPQLINELVNPPVIVFPGRRIISIKINNVEYDSLATYTMLVSDFLAEQSDNDGYVTFRNIPANKKENLGDNYQDAIKQYIKLYTPLTPVIQGRILYQ
jgi:2',3'-cyclic-nucleotide 2'-phosphodiesterase (5'-nucleotidase family)